jgi:hypothetical protein
MVPVFRSILSPVAFDDHTLPGSPEHGCTLHVVQTDPVHLQEERQHATTEE